MKRKILLVMLFCFMPAFCWGLPVSVTFEPLDSQIKVGDIFTVDLVADIPEPVLGWGLDLSYDLAVLNLVGMPTFGPDWIAGLAADGDGLAGLAFPSPVSGSDILLASLSFEALAPGVSALAASTTPGDFTEGFPVYPAGFANVDFIDGSVTVSPVPEPATILLLISGMAGLGVFGRKKFMKN
jgi:hypothetical protein